jgi:hypothetical protein
MCDCIDQLNERLEGYNTQVWLPLAIEFSTGNLSVPKRVHIVVEKIDDMKRKGPMPVQAAYCPFCGEEYVKKAT